MTQVIRALKTRLIPEIRNKNRFLLPLQSPPNAVQTHGTELPENHCDGTELPQNHCAKTTLVKKQDNSNSTF